MLKRLCTTLVLVLSIAGTAFAQISISGTVRDSVSGAPLAGVTVKVMDTNQGTITDQDGAFKIDIPDRSSVLIFSYLGYEAKEVKASSGQVLNVSLSSRNNTLSQIVVVGYGTQRKGDLTTSIGSVSGKSITERPTTTNVVQGLAGKVAGVNVMVNSGRPGGSPMIKIRGTGSLNASNNPLYVVDGIVGVDPNTIDPNIIASVDILKDAAAASIYGSRGSNGVVVITTKRGARNSSSISFNNTVSFGMLQHEVPLLDATGALEMLKREYAYVPGRLAPHLDPNNNFPRKSDLFNADGTPKYNTDWQKATTRTAVSHIHSLTFSGGKDDLTAIANISLHNDEGIVRNTNSKQLDAFVKINWDVKPWLNIQTSLIAGGSQAKGPDLAGYPQGQNAIRRMYSTMPFLPVKYPDGTYSTNGDYPGAEDAENPVRLLNDIQNVVGKTYALGNIIGTFHLSPHLDFTSTFSGQTATGYTFYYAGTGLKGISDLQNGIAQRTNANSGAWTNEDYFTYKNTFGKSSLNVVAGASWYYNIGTSTFAGTENFFDNTFAFNSLQAGSTTEPSTSNLSANQFNSYYARVHYGYDNRYLLDASYRIDGSSRFGSNNKYGQFPSVSAGWVISNENFFQGLAGTINNLKIRASYGFVGNAEIGDYITMARLVNSQTVFNHTRVSDVTLGSLPNNNLSWEKSNQFDIGLDVDLFSSRIQFTVDVYNKITKDLLYSKALPATSGFAGAIDNIGSIRNKGLEITLNTVNINAGDFSWNTGLNYSLNRSDVLNLNGDIMYPWGGRIMEGQPLNEFYGYERLGTWSTKEAAEAAKYGLKPGDKKYKDFNNDGVINADDERNLGNAMPKFEMNMTNTFTYKNLSLYVDLESMIGLHVLNNTKQFLVGEATNVNGLKDILHAWTPDHQNTMIPALRTTADPNAGISNVGDSYYVEDGTFLRVRNIAFTYRFDAGWLKHIMLQNLSVGINVENAFLFTKYDGYDPEINSFGGDLVQGIDIYQYPKPRTISISLNATF